MKIDNKHRKASWEQIAKEFQSERDALQNDVYRAREDLAGAYAIIEREGNRNDELNRVKAELDDAYAELNKIWAGHHVLFNREVYERAQAWYQRNFPL